MPNTPTYQFPYPAGTDRVMDGDNAMGALGLAIENVLKAHPLFSQQVCTAQFAIPQNPAVQITGMQIQITPTQPELWVAMFAVDLQLVTVDPGAVTAQLLYDNNPLRTITWTPGVVSRMTQASFHVFNASANVQHTLEVRAGKANSTGAVQAMTPSVLSLLRFPR